MQIPMNPLKGVRIHECVGRSSPLGRGRREAPGEGCRFGQVSSNLATLTLPSPRGRGFMTVYPMARVSTLGMLGRFAAALVAVVLALFLFTIGDGILVTILGAMVGPALGATYSVALTSWALSATFNAVLGLVLFAYHDRWSHATTRRT